LGIGTSSPTAKIHATTATAGYAAKLINTNGAYDANGLLIQAGTVGSEYALNVTNTAGTSNFFTVKGDGNVGIGTSSPSAYTGYATLALNGSSGGELDLMVGGTNKGALFSNASSIVLQSTSGSDLPLVFRTNSVERMRLTSSGNLGIGTSSPYANLHVYETGSGDATIKVGNIQGVETLNIGRQGASGYGATSAGDAFVYTSTTNLSLMSDGAASVIKFTAGGNTERMRLDAGGNFFVGATALTANANFFGTSPGNAFSDFGHVTGVGSGVAYTRFLYGGSVVGSITQNGTSQVLFNVSSDQRLKENIADANDAGSKIDAIKVRQYDWKADGSHQDYGMVAQELQAVAPEAVSGDPKSDEMMGVDYSKFVPMMLKEIQSLRARIAILEGA